MTPRGEEEKPAEEAKQVRHGELTPEQFAKAFEGFALAVQERMQHPKQHVRAEAYRLAQNFVNNFRRIEQVANSNPARPPR